METAFAKIVTDMNGWNSILIEGRVVSLVGGSLEANNEMVKAIVLGLRRAGTERSGIVGIAGTAQSKEAACLGQQAG